MAVSDETENNDPSHPRFIAGFKAGHAAGRKRGELAEREVCANICDHEQGTAGDAADKIRMRSNGEVRGASRLAGEASSAEGATSTVLLGAVCPGKD